MAGVLETTLAAYEPLDASIYHFHEMEYDDVDYALKEHIGAHNLRDIERAHSRTCRRLDAFCKGLLEVDAQHRVQYLHRTVKDWLETAAMRAYLEENVKPGFRAKLSILRAYLALYRHPLVGSEVKIKPKDLNINWSGWIVDIFVEAVPYAYITDGPCQCSIQDEVYSILDGFYSATIEFFKAGLVTFAGQTQGMPGADCVLMLRSNLLFFGPWCYLTRKVKEIPDYFMPVVKCPKAIRLRVQIGTDATNGEEESSARAEVATSVLKHFLDENWPENIANPNGEPLDNTICKKMETLEFLTIPVCLIGQGADPGVIMHTAADSLPIPAWLGFILLAFKLKPSLPDMGTSFLEYLGLILDEV